MSCHAWKVFEDNSSLLTVTHATENPAKCYKLLFFRHPTTEILNRFFCEVLTNSHCSVHHHGANKANRRVRSFLKRRSARETADADQSLGDTSEDHRKMRHLVLCTVRELLFSTSHGLALLLERSLSKLHNNKGLQLGHESCFASLSELQKRPMRTAASVLPSLGRPACL